MSFSEAMLELPREHDPGPRSAFGAREFFRAFFADLEAHEIPYAILHGGDELPDRIDSDIDFAVQEADLAKLGPLIAGLAGEHGWVVAQRWQHEVSALYTVVIDPNAPAQHLALDACSHFCRAGCFLVRDTVLLARRARHANGFFVTSAASEFTYRLAKALAGGRPLEAAVPSLRELWVLDAAGAQRAFDDLLAAGSVEKWLFGPKPDAPQLARLMRARTRYSLALRVAEIARRARRFFRPPGLHIALLGPDGAGKSTLIENLTRSLKPCFPAQRTYKFRPDVFGRITPATQPAPHLREPRGTLVSWAKIAYYFGDWWLGFFTRIWPARRRGTLIVFDRNFADLAVDQRRYLVQGVGLLARLLRHFVPRADATFILDADPERVHARKPELPVEVLARQRHAYRRLASGDARCRLVCADQSAQDVAREVSRRVITQLGAREERRERKWSKRVFDLVFAASALLVLAPVLGVVACLVRVRFGAPILFRQQRPGLHGRAFSIVKFRTMTNERDADGRLLPDAQRLTKLGRLLRSLSLDEFPELWNVLKGEMSIVGPRPLLMEYLPLYSRTQARRHDVLPGITGWAQVNGRNEASWPRKFALDVWYIDHHSLWLDLKIIGLTFWTVLRRHGITQPGRATADRFRGEQEPIAS